MLGASQIVFACFALSVGLEQEVNQTHRRLISDGCNSHGMSSGVTTFLDAKKETMALAGKGATEWFICGLNDRTEKAYLPKECLNADDLKELGAMASGFNLVNLQDCLIWYMTINEEKCPGGMSIMGGKPCSGAFTESQRQGCCEHKQLLYQWTERGVEWQADWFGPCGVEICGGGNFLGGEVGDNLTEFQAQRILEADSMTVTAMLHWGFVVRLSLDGTYPRPQCQHQSSDQNQWDGLTPDEQQTRRDVCDNLLVEIETNWGSRTDKCLSPGLVDLKDTCCDCGGGHSDSDPVPTTTLARCNFCDRSGNDKAGDCETWDCDDESSSNTPLGCAMFGVLGLLLS